MSDPKRLFDCILQQGIRPFLPDMLAGKENGKWRAYSSEETIDTIHKLSAGLLRLGISGQDGTIEGRDKVAVISKNRPEWIMLDLAVQQTGAILTPV